MVMSMQPQQQQQMQLQLQMLLLFVLLPLTVEAVIRPADKLHVMENEGFVAYMDVAKSFGQIRNCWFRYQDTEKLRLTLNATKPLLTSRGELVLPYAVTICGIRVMELSLASAGLWHLEVENIFGDYEKNSIQIGILTSQPKRRETHIVREPGKGTISCSKHDTYTQYCTIYEMYTGKIWPQCQLSTTMRANSTFECQIYNWGRILPMQEHIIVDVLAQSANTNATHSITDVHDVLSCQFDSPAYSCQAVLPGGKQELLIMDGMYDGRYSAYDTQIAKSRCSLEVLKPLKPHEIGLWRIINHRFTPADGCLFYVGETAHQIIERELLTLAENTRRINASTTDKSLEDLECMLPFVVDECFLRDPNNTIYYPDPLSFRRTASYGKCSFSNLPLIAGIWTCGARSASYEKEVLEDIEVVVMPPEGESLTEKVKAKVGDSVELMCRSAYEMPITRCAFVDPQGNVYVLATIRSIKTLGHVHYFGRGLNFGECGIKINQLTAADFGSWRCQFGGNTYKTDSIFVIWIKETAIGNATAIGLGIGITVVILLVAGVIIATVFYRRRNLMAQHSFPSADPLQEFQGSAPTAADPAIIVTSRL